MREKDEFLGALQMDLMYWQSLPNQSVYQRLRGLVFSILAQIDGEGSTPGYEMRVLRENDSPGEDIAGDLHEIWSRSVSTDG